jgi:hypothetical protein
MRGPDRKKKARDKKAGRRLDIRPPEKGRVA